MSKARLPQASKELAGWARERGWIVSLTGSGHLRFERAGCRTVFGSKTPGDWRSFHKIRAKIKLAEREAMTEIETQRAWDGAVSPPDDKL